MTFGALIEEVLENVSLAPGSERIQRAEVKRLLNLAMREISLRTGLPTLYVTVPGDGTFQTGAFALPVQYHPEGVRYAEVIEVQSGSSDGVEAMENREISIMSVAEANQFHPRWEDDDYRGVPFLVHNPLSRDAGIRPVGIESARYRFLLHANPPKMILDEHEPFAIDDYCEDPPIRREGGMPAYHRVLAHHVSYELLQRLGHDSWQAFFARYRAMEEEIFNGGQQAVVRLPQWRPSRQVRRYA